MKTTVQRRLPSGSARRRAFTLIELMVAMATFAILMFAAFSFFGNAQATWRTADASARIYENARIAFSIIGTDLQCAVANKRPGEEIPFKADATGKKLDFVSAIPNTTATQDLCQVSYALANNELQRSRTPFVVGGPLAAPGVSYSIAGGVESISFYCTDATGTPLPAAAVNVLPATVTVTLTLIDERLTGASVSADAKNKTKRTFTRTFFIGGRQ